MDFANSTEIISLPSKGILYSKESGLSEGEIEVKYMTAKEEDILSNASYIKNGTVIDRLLQSLIVSKINYDDLLLGDKNALIIAARILGYGKDYEFQYYEGNDVKTAYVDLQKLKEKGIDSSFLKKDKINEFDFILPNSKISVTFKILNVGDDKAIDAEIKGMKTLNPDGSFDISTRLKYIILSVDGKYDKVTIRSFVDNHLRVSDIKELRKYYASISPDVELKYYPKDDYTKEGIDFQVGINFFWPDARI